MDTTSLVDYSIGRVETEPQGAQGYLRLEPEAPDIRFFLGALSITIAALASVPFGL